VNFMIYGVVLIVIVRLMPGGLVEGFKSIARRTRRGGGSGRGGARSAAVPPETPTATDPMVRATATTEGE
jgi:branched-chain amino acid transport system permease protein